MSDPADPAAKLRQVASNSVIVKKRVAALIHVIETAAPVDDNLADLWSRMQREFHANQQAIIEDLDRGGYLRPGLSVSDATDILWTLHHPRTYLLLVRERGWTPDRYEQWLAATLQHELLGLS